MGSREENVRISGNNTRLSPSICIFCGSSGGNDSNTRITQDLDVPSLIALPRCYVSDCNGVNEGKRTHV
ncbi:hypothetical protein RB195_020622 [Necator americanus]|uniref:Uncharacterized protein n=1 Tax=Necator americanus TaxID=51031 RepID=A0ABR1CLX8_NECAM